MRCLCWLVSGGELYATAWRVEPQGIRTVLNEIKTGHIAQDCLELDPRGRRRAPDKSLRAGEAPRASGLPAGRRPRPVTLSPKLTQIRHFEPKARKARTGARRSTRPRWWQSGKESVHQHLPTRRSYVVGRRRSWRTTRAVMSRTTSAHTTTNSARSCLNRSNFAPIRPSARAFLFRSALLNARRRVAYSPYARLTSHGYVYDPRMNSQTLTEGMC